MAYADDTVFFVHFHCFTYILGYRALVCVFTVQSARSKLYVVPKVVRFVIHIQCNLL